MADATLLDIAKLNGNDTVIGLIEENLSAAPELERFPVRTVKGTSFYTVKRTGFPAVGFRSANEGVVAGKSTFTKQLCELFILASAIKVDRAVAAAAEEGMGYWEMIESGGVIRQAMLTMGSQIWYGITNDPKGFPGIKSLVALGSTICIDAAGTTATTASSVYAVKYGPQNAHLVLGQNGAFNLDPFKDETLYDTGSPALPYAGRTSHLTAWTGLHVGNVNCLGRIANLTEDSGKGLTDTQLAKLMAAFPVGYTPDAIYMSRRSRRQLQVSRTTVINGAGNVKPSGGQANIGPTPSDYEGIPIVASDSILNTDAIES